MSRSPGSPRKISEERHATVRTPMARHGKVDVSAIRDSLGVSNRDFASLLGCSYGSLSQWATGRTEPSGPALTLMLLLEKYPTVEDQLRTLPSVEWRYLKAGTAAHAKEGQRSRRERKRRVLRAAE